VLLAALCSLVLSGAPATAAPPDRMAWWREARFGMFIHWGLYAIPGGEWGGPKAGTNHAEWIRTTAQIPLAEYDKLLAKFNPVNFNAEEIVLAAKNAGMGYIVITSKHHDGFCLFDTVTTDFDVMSTPFKRDILREMADACRRHGIKICWYYSIMDWHHPDYLPRRDWEQDRPTEGADFDRYVAYMKAQLKELLTNYGEIGVLWFDGQWEGNWTDERGRDLEKYVRSIAPNVIINSRVGRAGGNYGLDTASGMLGDYATPEQFIPDSDPGFDWETCMTMNNHWGYNRADKNFKSTTDLVRKLVDIASKGGNFLLNIGPDELGNIPPESVNRLAEIGEWWNVNSESIRGTRASPFPAGYLPWGRCTTKTDRMGPGSTRLYLHVFNWPADSVLVIPGIFNELARVAAAFPLSPHPARAVDPRRIGDSIQVPLTGGPYSDHDSVVVLDVLGSPDIAIPPTISAAADIFIESLPITLSTTRDGVQIHYTLDGSDPTADSPIAAAPVALERSATVRAACFRDGRVVSPITSREFRRVSPQPAVTPAQTAPGVLAKVFTWDTGDIQSVEALASMQAISETVVSDFSLKALQPREKHWGVVHRGYLRVPKTAVYEFTTGSDDGSRLWIGDTLVVDNDLPHSFKAERGVIALEAGLHPIRVAFFENWGGFDLRITWRTLGENERAIGASDLLHEP
jgi:alpha-L-fucosidase